MPVVIACNSEIMLYRLSLTSMSPMLDPVDECVTRTPYSSNDAVGGLYGWFFMNAMKRALEMSASAHACFTWRMRASSWEK